MAARAAILAAGRGGIVQGILRCAGSLGWAVGIRNPRNLLGLAAACGVAFCVLLILAYASPGARWLDASALQGFTDLQGDRVGRLATRIAKFGDPGPVI